MEKQREDFIAAINLIKKKADQEEADIKNLKSELETFIWYWHRYDSQLKAEDFAKTQKKNVEKKNKRIN